MRQDCLIELEAKIRCASELIRAVELEMRTDPVVGRGEVLNSDLRGTVKVNLDVCNARLGRAMEAFSNLKFN